MKKQRIKTLRLNKEKISSLKVMNTVKGGTESYWQIMTTKLFICTVEVVPPKKPEPTPASVFPACNSNHAHCPM